MQMTHAETRSSACKRTCAVNTFLKRDGAVRNWAGKFLVFALALFFALVWLAVPGSVCADSQVTVQDFVAVSAGSSYTVALKADGTVWMWGQNGYDYLQLGDQYEHTRVPRYYDEKILYTVTPAQVSGLADVVAVAAGYVHCLALKADGTVWAWGWGWNPTPSMVSGLTDVVAIAAGLTGSMAVRANMAVRADGTVWVWEDDQSTPVAVAGLTDMVAVARGYHHSLALKADGTVWAWGWNTKGQLGDGTTTSRDTPIEVPGLAGITAIACGSYNSLAMHADGTVWAWGDYYGGFRPSPAPVSGLTDAIAVVGAKDNSLALKADGTVWAWGGNDYGQLGDGTEEPRGRPVRVTGLTDVVKIAGGTAHSVAVKSDGSVWAWGNNDFGQLGVWTSTEKSMPAVPVPGMTDITALSGGGDHLLALDSDGTLWSWGSNSYGQLGDGTTSDSDTAVAVSGMTDVTDIACGFNHNLALRTDGTVWAWGKNNKGQLGDGSTEDSSTPAAVSNLSDIVSIAAGYEHSLAVQADGTVWAWGSNSYGQLGDLNLSDSSTPVRVRCLTDIVAVAAGGDHNMALKADGTVWDWGYNGACCYNEGDYDRYDQSAPPYALDGLVDVVSIAAGSAHGVALKGDGTVWAWGSNYGYQLGVVTRIEDSDSLSPAFSSTPVYAYTLTDVAAIAANGVRNLALKEDGTIWAWGGAKLGPYRSIWPFLEQTGLSRPEPLPATGLTDIIDLTKAGDFNAFLREDGTVWVWDSDAFDNLRREERQSSVPLQSTLNLFEDGVSSVQFSRVINSLSEASDTIDIAVKRTGDGSGPVTVDYASYDISATAGEEYLPTSGTITFEDGVTGEKFITVSVIDDDLIEQDETIGLLLSNPTGNASLGPQSATWIDIEEDDEPVDDPGDPAPNMAPEIIEGPAASAHTIIETEKPQLSVFACDPDGDKLRYAWTPSPGQGFIDGSGSIVTYIPPEVLEAQTFTIMVTVDDQRGKSATGSVDITVLPAEESLITAEADTYVHSLNPEENFGSEPWLYVDGLTQKITYLRFNVTGLSGPVYSARVRLYVDLSGDGGTIYHVSDSNWDENTVTYNSRPAIDGSALDNLGMVNDNHYAEFDVTAAISGDGTYSFAITPDSNEWVRYQSLDDEYILTGNHPPELVINTLIEGKKNSPPVIDSGPTATPDTIYSNETAQLSVAAGDVDQDPLTYTWTVPDGQGTITGTGAAVTFIPPEVNWETTITITVMVDDGREGSAAGTVDVTVIPAEWADDDVIESMFAPVADTWVNSSHSNTNYGSDTILEVDGSPPQIAYFRFDVNGLRGMVQSAQLTLSVADPSNHGGVIYLVSDSSWDEDSVTYNTRPTIDGPALDAQGEVNVGDTVTLDVTSAISGDGTYSFAIISDNYNGAEYRSREDASYPPVLIITTRVDGDTNTPPVIDSGPTATPDTIYSNETAQLSVAASDADQDPLTYIWTVPAGQGAISGTGATVTFTPPAATEEQTVTVTVVVDDGNGESASGSVALTVLPEEGGGGEIESIFAPVADTWVNSSHSNTNYGSDMTLEVDGSPVQIAYFRFDINGLNGTVRSARLRLKVADPASVGGTIYRVPDSSWDEDVVTYTTRPAMDGPALDSLGIVGYGDTVELDVTSAISGDGTYCFAITSSDSNGADYRSREDASYPPELIITTWADGGTNTPPVIDSGPTATPATIYSNETAQLSVAASDADQDPLTYTWMVPGRPGHDQRNRRHGDLYPGRGGRGANRYRNGGCG